MNDLMFKQLAAELKAGNYVPFLGAGSSRCENIPSGQELSEHIMGKACLCAEDIRPSECTCKSTCNCNHTAVSLESAASYLEATRSREDLETAIREKFKESEPLGIHNYLAGIDCALLIITTNYDRLLERAFLDRTKKKAFDVLSLRPREGHSGRELVLVRYDESGNRDTRDGIDPEMLAKYVDLEKRTLIYKIHGTLGIPGVRDHFLITEADYENAILDIDRFLPPAIVEHLDGRLFLFLGYGLRDWNVRAIFRRLTRFTRFAASPGKVVVSGPTKIDEVLWKERNLTAIDMRIDDFVNRLLDA